MAANCTIVASRRLDLKTCEFDLLVQSGTVEVAEWFDLTERGTLWGWVITAVVPHPATEIVTVSCVTWLVESGAHVGENVTTRRTKAAERKSFGRTLPEGFFEGR